MRALSPADAALSRPTPTVLPYSINYDARKHAPAQHFFPVAKLRSKKSFKDMNYRLIVLLEEKNTELEPDSKTESYSL